MRHLESFGLRCVYAGDIDTGRDALKLTAADCDGAPIITNTPYKKPLMHDLIVHFQEVAPFAWLLLELEWASRKLSRPFQRSCTDIVPIGQIKWIEGSKHASYEHYAWYRFEAGHTAGAIWRTANWCLRRRLAPARIATSSYRPQRSDPSFCSSACRQRAYRERLTVTQA